MNITITHDVKLGHDKTAELDDPAHGKGECQDDGPDLVVGTGQVQRDVGEPVNSGHRVGKEDKPGLVEATRALTSLESIKGCQYNEEKRVDEACHDCCVLSKQQDDVVDKLYFIWRFYCLVDNEATINAC